MAQRKRRGGSRSTFWDQYLQYSQTPLASLLVILPILAIHEIGMHRFVKVGSQMVEYRVTAWVLMSRFFDWCYGPGRYLPALAVILMLLLWHVVKGDPWKIDLNVIPLVAGESLLWAMPLAAVYGLTGRFAIAGVGGEDWALLASLFLGAGVYEEMVFRLGLFSILTFFIVKLGKTRSSTATILILTTSAVLFSTYHLLGSVPLPWQSLVLTGLRGIYYGIIFLYRGFGVCACVHIAYDLIILSCWTMGWR